MTALIVFCAQHLIAGILAAAVVRIWFSPTLRLRVFYTALVALPLAYALARVAGLFYNHPQPFAIEGTEPLIPHSINNAFPSDHTVVGGVFASLTFLVDKRFGLLLWAMVLLMGAARVAAGLHYWQDIIGSVVLAVLVVSATYAALRRFGR